MVRLKKKIIFFLAASVSFSVGLYENAYAMKYVDRISGSDRYETSFKVCEKAYKLEPDLKNEPKINDEERYAFIATGENYPDALSVIPPSKKLRAPLLLTEKDKLNTFTKDKLISLKVKSVIIIGGYGVIGESVDKELQSMNIEVNRIFGADRYETSLKTAEMLMDLKLKEVFVVNGENFKDAISVSSIAAKLNAPILLCSKDKIHDGIVTYLNKVQAEKVYVIGNESVISKEVFDKIPYGERIGSENQYDNNISIIERFKDKFDFKGLFLATGKNFS